LENAGVVERREDGEGVSYDPWHNAVEGSASVSATGCCAN
jgi:hypothetical protein